MREFSSLSRRPSRGPKLPFTCTLGLTMLQPISGYHTDGAEHCAAQSACSLVFLRFESPFAIHHLGKGGYKDGQPISPI